MYSSSSRAPGARSRLAFAFVFGASLLSAIALATEPRPLYKDPKADVEQRVEDLLARMTLAEKIAQITAIWTQKPQMLRRQGRFRSGESSRRSIPHGIGQFSRPNDLAGPGSPLRSRFAMRPERSRWSTPFRSYQMTKTRLGIPMMFHEEALHGYAARGATNFPDADRACQHLGSGAASRAC